MPYEPVIWKDFVNTVALPNPNDLKKVSGVDGDWDAFAISKQKFFPPAEGCAIKFKLNPTSVVVPWPVYAGLAVVEYGIPGGMPYRIGMGLSLTIIRTPWDLPPVLPAYPGQYFTIKLVGSPAKVEFWVSDTLLFTSSGFVTQPYLFMAAGIYYLGNIGIIDAWIDIGVVAKVDHLPLMGVH